jgi:hypothetical protein
LGIYAGESTPVPVIADKPQAAVSAVTLK